MLNWLLKKLKSNDVRVGGPKLHFQTWHLLQQLITRIPAKAVARLLSRHGFIVFVQTTLEWLRSNCKPASVWVSDESGVEGSQAESRKRKRTDTNSGPSQGLKFDSTRVFVSILSTIRQIEAKVSESSLEEQALTEHLNVCLRSKPEDAARMLGSCLEIIKHCLSDESSQPLLSKPYENIIYPSRRLWESRFPSTEEDSEFEDTVG